ncbi:XK-related protein 9 [Gadus morhua]|uniref:XK-related protein n=1 Tax=Gadus morhua TaxID=8049 RepID=A0A8C4ZMM8_GADMO|nr:XK-related protein 9-like [Gadus morhua]XP_030204215.1 XK-related protein 9-like [Gadus morhua]
MLPAENRYSKLRWFWTIASLLFYIADIGSDVGLVLKYVRERHFLWAGLTGAFVLVGLAVTQVFSYAWYKDDMKNPEGKPILSTLSCMRLVSLHVLGMGILTRYVQLLKAGHRELWAVSSAPSPEEERGAHHRLFCLATDLSMLKLFEAFLESVPQLLLQIFLILRHGECSHVQYVCMAFSCLNAAWALVDYRRCLRRSLPAAQEMPAGLPTAVYLLYKLLTLASRLLAFSLLLCLSPYALGGLAALWLLGTLWAYRLQTSFCTRRTTEWVYRAAVGAVLTFTFFNVKGQATRTPMTLYYLLHAAVNAAAPLLFALLWKPPLSLPGTTAAPPLAPTATELWYFWAVVGAIAVGTGAGLLCLAVYYARMHPPGKRREADEVDGPGGGAPPGGVRMRKFLQL